MVVNVRPIGKKSSEVAIFNNEFSQLMKEAFLSVTSLTSCEDCPLWGAKIP
jgi:hypothetical protein